MDDPIMIDAHDIRFSYDGPGGRRSLNGAHLHVSPGEFVAVLGHNGCGKSTLVKHFNALLPLQHGTLTVDGMDAADPANRWALRRKVGMVFQNPDNQFVSTIVGEDVAFGLENYGVPEDEIPARVAAALAAVDMAGYENRATHTLSGGQKQRVALAGVLALLPDILVFDEATAMLDPRGREQVMQTIHHLNKDMGITVVSITHYMEEAAQADRVLVMSNKKIAMYDTVEKVFARAPELLELGLSVPQVTKIFLKLREMGVDVPADVYTIPYAVKTILAAKARRDAGETLVLPRNENTQEGGAAGC